MMDDGNKSCCVAECGNSQRQPDLVKAKSHVDHLKWHRVPRGTSVKNMIYLSLGVTRNSILGPDNVVPTLFWTPHPPIDNVGYSIREFFMFMLFSYVLHGGGNNF